MANAAGLPLRFAFFNRVIRLFSGCDFYSKLCLEEMPELKKNL
jgi:hypothetical protein